MKRWFARRFVLRTVTPCFFLFVVLWQLINLNITIMEDEGGANTEETAHAEVHKVDDTVKPAEAPKKPASSSYESFLQLHAAPGKSLQSTPHTPTPSLQDHRLPNAQSRQQGVALLQPQDYIITGYLKPKRKFLTIGIPTIYRQHTGHKYLEGTISSLLSNARPEDMPQLTILIFLADLQDDKRNEIKSLLLSKYQNELESGTIILLEVKPSVYPPLTGLKQNYRDKPQRVTWRSKQVCDFAFMFYVARNFSDYYIQIEDDVITTKDYLPKIKSFIQQQLQTPWVTLSFSELGFIGKLFASSTLDPLARFFILFYQEMPVDFLYEHFAKILTLPRMPLRKPTLFQHMGDKSSLVLDEKQKGKPLKDRYFSLDRSPLPTLLPGSINPPGAVYTSLKTYLKNHPKYAYHGPDPKFFWATAPNVGDTYTVVFTSPLSLNVVAVITGHSAHPIDTLHEGVLEVGRELVSIEADTPQCAPWLILGEFMDGSIEVNLGHANLTAPVRCLRIRVTKAQEEWVIIDHITVTTVDAPDGIPAGRTASRIVLAIIVILLLFFVTISIKLVFCDTRKPPRQRGR